MTDPYRQCKFSDASGYFSVENLMRGSLWQVDGVSFQTVQLRSAGAYALAAPIDAFRKTQGHFKLLPFPSFF